MTELDALMYLYPGHPLLREIQDRDFEIARLHRVIAAADAKANRLHGSRQRIQAAAEAARQRQTGGAA